MGDTGFSVKELIRNSGANLRHGQRSEVLKDFFQKYGLDPSSLDVYDKNLAEKLKAKFCLIKEFEAMSSGIISLYKSTGSRGLTNLGKLMDLHVKILEREKKLSDEGKDPLEDEYLYRYNKLTFEMTKWLEHLKYDKEKTDRMLDTKKVDNDDVPFIMDVDPCNIPK